MPDSSNIDSALIALLLNDAQLMAICTDGVWMDEAAQGAQKFVIVSLADEFDDQDTSGRAAENPLYLVKAVALSTSGADVKTAAARIDALLQMQTMTAAGYTVTGMFRESRVRLTEVDSVDPSIRWQHRGGHYRIFAGVV